MNMQWGYYYDSPKKGAGWIVEAPMPTGTMRLGPMTKACANEIKRQMILRGHDAQDIAIVKGD